MNTSTGGKTDITAEECIECVRFRTICETWNGIVIRERNTVTILKVVSFRHADFVKVDGAFDHLYAVDYEIFLRGKPVCGVQIKPQSYTYETSYITKQQRQPG